MVLITVRLVLFISVIQFNYMVDSVNAYIQNNKRDRERLGDNSKLDTISHVGKRIHCLYKIYTHKYV